MPSMLITQCVQNDFVKPIGRLEPVPNALHIGHWEARRLMGEDPDEGPVARTMKWAYAQPEDELAVVHIRDWHDHDDPAQASHLERFGAHCIRDSDGAQFAFSAPTDRGNVTVVDSLTLNDFNGTQLADVIQRHRSDDLRVGLIGVWTEAKVSFLAYELRTRYPEIDLAVCSALTASSSRQHHFSALDQLERLLGVRVIDSVGEFIEFLGGSDDAPLLGLPDRFPNVEVTDGTPLSDGDTRLVRYMFRDCRTVSLKMLAGGFSGNIVAGAESVDLEGREQVPHVLKIGRQEDMGRERTSFERVQEILGNNAPQISDFADFGDRGIIKYRYASMGGEFSTTLQKLYQSGAELDRIGAVLDTVFGKQLRRFYRGATLEAIDLFEHYWFSSRFGPRVRQNVESILGRPAPDDSIELRPGVTVPNVCDFYDRFLAELGPRPRDAVWMATVHGDLNGQNIILDSNQNVWLIDFFHTRRAHVLMDLVKLENDLLYIFTPIDTEDELAEGFKLVDALLDVDDIAAQLPEASPSDLPQMRRAWETARQLRGFYPDLVQGQRDPFQLWVALLRYAGHTLSFDEPTPLQLVLALYSACRLSERVASNA